MKSRLLKRVALLAGLTGFLWSFVSIDPVVRSGRNASDLAESDGNTFPKSNRHRAGSIFARH